MGLDGNINLDLSISPFGFAPWLEGKQIWGNFLRNNTLFQQKSNGVYTQSLGHIGLRNLPILAQSFLSHCRKSLLSCKEPSDQSLHTPSAVITRYLCSFIFSRHPIILLMTIYSACKNDHFGFTPVTRPPTANIRLTGRKAHIYLSD